MTDSAPTVKVHPTARSQRFLVTFAAIFASIAALLVLDFSLAKVDRNETRQHAAGLFQEGQTILAAGRPSDAADRLATAVSLDRSNRLYGLALAQALMANGRFADAEQLLNDLLDRFQNDASVNLTMATLLTSTGRIDEAKAFYHRAIFGRWAGDSTRQRMEARFELIDLLARQGAHEELLAELLPLQSAAGDSTMLLRRVAPLYLRAGFPDRAADLYREVLRREPTDLPAYLGLSDADLALGQVRQARADLTRGARAFPRDTTIVHRLAAVDSALALDPGSRGLSDAERFRRSRALLERTLALVQECSAQLPTAEDMALRDSARVSLQTTKSKTWDASAFEHQLALSESLLKSGPRVCGPSWPSEARVVDLVQRLLIQ